MPLRKDKLHSINVSTNNFETILAFCGVGSLSK